MFEDFDYIVTHGGPANADQFRACCLLMAISAGALPIYRREPTPEELDDPEVMVVGTGGRFEPALGNFDPALATAIPATSILSTVLHRFGLYGLAARLFKWLPALEVAASRGNASAAAFLGITEDRLPAVGSPEVEALLAVFEERDELTPAVHPITFIMGEIGEHMLESLNRLGARLRLLSSLPRFNVNGVEVLDATSISVTDDPQFGVEIWAEEFCPELGVVVSRDTDHRSVGGYSFFRRNDHPQVDFRHLRDRAEILFVFTENGFLAKTKVPVSAEAVKELLELAIAPAAPVTPDQARAAHFRHVDDERARREATDDDRGDALGVAQRPDRFETL